jgi:hypothetical protein
MTKKVCISQAFRLCFSDELGGMPYTSDEIAPQEQTQDIPHVEVLPTNWAEAIRDCETEEQILEVWKLIPKAEQGKLKDVAKFRKEQINGTI